MLLRVLFIILVVMISATFSQTPPIEPGVSQKLAQWRGKHYSDVRYKLNITLEKGAPLMKGNIEIRVNLTDEAAKTYLVLDWRTTQFENDKDKPFADVVSVNESIIKKLPETGEYAYSINKEHIVIAQRLLKSGENVIKIEFASPIKTSGAAITRYVDKEDNAEYIYSLFVPSDASTAFPVFDQPDLKARFQLNVIAPKNWNIIANTEIKSADENFFIDPSKKEYEFLPKDYELTTFEETLPISTYVFAFAAGEFRAFVDEQSMKSFNKNATTRFRLYVRKSQLQKADKEAKEVFRLNREGVKYLESYFDYKFPFPKYDLVLIPEFPFGGMEHAGATFLRESSVIFPNEPTKNDFVSRANLIFHEAAHQWFGDTVTMKWFDDLWLKEGFAEFMAYKTLAQVMPEYNAWKIFYERNKQLAYLTDSTKGTTPIYQEITNLSSAKSAYGNIVYRKAPSFLKQAEFYLGEKEFQTAVRAFLKKHEFKNAEWKDLVTEFQTVSWTSEPYRQFWKGFSAKKKKEVEERDKKLISDWAEYWVKQKGVAIIRTDITEGHYEKSETSKNGSWISSAWLVPSLGLTLSSPFEDSPWALKIKTLYKYEQETEVTENLVSGNPWTDYLPRLFDKDKNYNKNYPLPDLIFPNYQDYGYGIFLLDEKSRDYVLENIQNEKDDFLRTMMWGALWDSVREGELAPKDYVELVIKNINTETDESTIQTLLNRVSTAMNYYIVSEPSAVADGSTVNNQNAANNEQNPPATAGGSDLVRKLEDIMIDKMQSSPTVGMRITFYRAFLNIASSEKARVVLKEILSKDFGFGGGNTKMRAGSITDKSGKTTYAASPAIPLKTKDLFDIIARLFVIGDPSALDLLKQYEKEPLIDVERYAYATRAAFANKENKAKYWNDFVNNKDISESWIEAAFVTFNSSRQTDLTLPYLEKALAELPNLKKNRKIFFVNGWLSSFIGGQKSEEALKIINKFLADNPNLDKDLRLKILENVDVIERAVKIRK